MCNQKTCSQANRMTECCRLLTLLLLNYWTYLSGQLNRDTRKKTAEISNKKNCHCLTSLVSSLQPGRPVQERKPAETHQQKSSEICIRSAARHRHLDSRFSFWLSNILWKTSLLTTRGLPRDCRHSQYLLVRKVLYFSADRVIAFSISLRVGISIRGRLLLETKWQ